MQRIDFQRNKLWIAINGCAIVIYSIQFHFIGFPDKHLMFNNVDSPQYEAVGKWLFGGPHTEAIAIRPFLFPLCYTGISSLLGLSGFFIVQSLLWLITINLLFLALIRLHLPAFVAFMAAFVFCLQLTILSVAYEVLPELFTVCLCSFYCFKLLSVKNITGLYNNTGVLFCISAILVLFKPVFEPFFLASLGGVFYTLVRKRDEARKIKYWLIAGLSMIVFQLLMMAEYTGRFSLSEIGTVTFRRYLLSETLSQTAQMDLEAARAEIITWPFSQVLRFIIAHFPAIVENYFHNLHTNISTFPNETSAIGSPGFELSFMTWWNKFHWMAQLGLLALLIGFNSRIRRSADCYRILLLALPMYNVLLVSGISFGQGERLILPAIPFAVCLIPMVLRACFPAYWKKFS